MRFQEFLLDGDIPSPFLLFWIMLIVLEVKTTCSGRLIKIVSLVPQFITRIYMHI